MKKMEPYINSLNIDSKQKSSIYSKILSRKKNITNVLEKLKIMLYEREKNNLNNEMEL